MNNSVLRELESEEFSAYLVIQACDLLLTGGGQQERVHLGLQCIVHLDIDVVARSLLLVIGVHTAQ